MSSNIYFFKRLWQTPLNKSEAHEPQRIYLPLSLAMPGTADFKTVIDAQMDTGADTTSISLSDLELLGIDPKELVPVDFPTSTMADGRTSVDPVVLVDLQIPNGAHTLTLKFFPVTLTKNGMTLLGLDILQFFHYQVSANLLTLFKLREDTVAQLDHFDTAKNSALKRLLKLKADVRRQNVATVEPIKEKPEELKIPRPPDWKIPPLANTFPKQPEQPKGLMPTMPSPPKPLKPGQPIKV